MTRVVPVVLVVSICGLSMPAVHAQLSLVSVEQEIEIGRETKTVSVEVLRGAESDAAWKDVIVATYPSFAPYEAKSGRRIAVARLTPTA